MTRKYEKSHPWITFEIECDELCNNLIGEVNVLKNELSNFRAKKRQQATNESRWQLAHSIQSSGAIENNTVSVIDIFTYIFSDVRLSRGDYTTQERQEARNLCKIYNTVLHGNYFNQIAAEEYAVGMTPQHILGIHRVIMSKIKLPYVGNIGGRYRKYGVRVGGYVCPDSEDVEYLTGQMCVMINLLLDNGEQNQVLAALLAHLYIAWIHPFGDGNGRTARALELMLMGYDCYDDMSIFLTAQHCWNNRMAYYDSFNECREHRSALPFLHFMLNGYIIELQQLLDRLE